MPPISVRLATRGAYSLGFRVQGLGLHTPEADSIPVLRPFKPNGYGNWGVLKLSWNDQV